MIVIKWLKNILFYLFLFILIYVLCFSIYAHFNVNSLELTPPKTAFDPVCQPNNLLPVDKNKKVVSILFVSGGGISGIVPLTYLNYIEKKTNKKISELFDVFSGTSTGSIIVSSLNIPDEKGHSKFTSENILNIYIKFSADVMRKDNVRQFLTLNGMLGPHLDINLLHNKLKKYFGNTQFKSLVRPTYVSSFNMNTAKIEFFNYNTCRNHFNYGEFYIADLIAANCAAPALFSAVTFNNPLLHKKVSYIDSAVISNNSFPFVFRQLLKTYPNAKKYIILYLDTGNFHISSLNLDRKRFDRWGYLNWVHPLIQILFESQSKQIHQGIIYLLEFFPKNKIAYHYFTSNSKANAFDTSKENIAFILNEAQVSLKQHQDELDEAIYELLQAKAQ